MKIFKEFKEFAFKGNAIDLAVGVIIGNAFSKIVSSIVSDLFMPLIFTITGSRSLKDWKFVLKHAENESDNIVLNYGAFLENVIDFFIIAIVVFLFVKLISLARNKVTLLGKGDQNMTPPAPEPAPTKEEVLLTEIRDLLKQQNETGAK